MATYFGTSPSRRSVRSTLSFNYHEPPFLIPSIRGYFRSLPMLALKFYFPIFQRSLVLHSRGQTGRKQARPFSAETCCRRFFSFIGERRSLPRAEDYNFEARFFARLLSVSPSSSHSLSTSLAARLLSRLSHFSSFRHVCAKVILNR